MKNRLLIGLGFIIIAIIMLFGILKLIDKTTKTKKFFKESNKIWGIYFAPTTTDVSYGNNKSIFSLVNSKSNILQYKEKAYPLTGIEYFNDKVLFQTASGIKELGSKEKLKNILGNKDTIGYRSSGILKNYNFYYFFTNQSYKSGEYFSQIIIGDEKEQKVHEINSFLVSYGDDGKNIYMITHDEEKKGRLIIQKILVNENKEIEIIKEKIDIDGENDSKGKIIKYKEYIYSFVVNYNRIEGDKLYILKFSEKDLKLVSKTVISKNEEASDFMISSKKAMFNKENIVYFLLDNGKICSFNLINNKLNEEFKIDNFDSKKNLYLLGYYSEQLNNFNFIYYDDIKNKYIISVYNLDGKLLELFSFKNENKDKGLFPHSFIRIK